MEKPKKTLILINGGMGAGKSTCSELLANHLVEKNIPALNIKMDSLQYFIPAFNLNRQENIKVMHELAASLVIKGLENNFIVILEKALNAR